MTATVAPTAPATPAAAPARKLGLKESHALLTQDLGWTPSYQPPEAVYPLTAFEGIRIHDWSGWEDPFRLTMDAYWKYQGEKERKLYAIIDAFQQNNGQFNVSDARYIQALKLFVNGVIGLEYTAHRGFAMIGRELPGTGARIAAQMQSIDELRHAQTQIHALSHYNRFFTGMAEFPHQFDRTWYLSIPKSFFEDAISAGPFEFIVAISFSFEYVHAHLPVHQIYQGTQFHPDSDPGAPDFNPHVAALRYMGIEPGVDGGDFDTHADARHWTEWTGRPASLHGPAA